MALGQGFYRAGPGRLREKDVDVLVFRTKRPTACALCTALAQGLQGPPQGGPWPKPQVGAWPCTGAPAPTRARRPKQNALGASEGATVHT